MPETLEQPRQSDGRFAPSNPAATSTDSAESQDSSQTPAQSAASQDADYAKIWEEVKSRTTQEDPASPDNPESATPTPIPSDAGRAGESAKADTSVSQTAPETPATPAEPTGFALADYGDTMSASERALLKSVKFLPPAAQWKGMSEEERLDLIDGARSLRNQNNRRFNERNNPQAGQPAQQVHTQPVSKPAGSTGQTQPTGQVDVSNLPPDVAQHLAQVATEFGEESSIYRSQLAMAQRYEEQLQRLQSFADESVAERQKAAQEKFDRQNEDVASERLANKFPQLADPAKRELAREKGREWIRVHVKSLDDRGYFNNMTKEQIAQFVQTLPEKAMEFGAAFHFSQENQQTSQKSREAARTRSLSSTFAPNTPAKPVTNAPVDEDEAYRKAWNGVEAAHRDGKSGKDAVRQALRAVS